MLKHSLEAAERGQPANDTLKWFESYHPYERHMAWLLLQIISHSDVARGFTVGKSHEGREQAGIIIGSGPNNVVLHGLQHAREWITGSVVEFLIEQLLEGDDERVSGYLEKYTFHIIPIMNPDGFVISQTVHRLHRKNAQRLKDCIGVDSMFPPNAVASASALVCRFYSDGCCQLIGIRTGVRRARRPHFL